MYSVCPEVYLIASEASFLVKSVATLSIYILVVRMRSSPGPPVNAQTSGQPVKDQRSLKSPRKWLICYLTLEWQSCSHSYGQRIEYETRCPFVTVRTYKTPANRFLRNKNCIRFNFLLPLSAPGPNGQN